jgi:hypothetical protein
MRVLRGERWRNALYAYPCSTNDRGILSCSELCVSGAGLYHAPQKVAAMVQFSRVQAILNGAVQGWETRTGHPAQLFRHGTAFGWRTRDELLQSSARGVRLITDENIAQQTGDAANLVVALRTGVPGFPRMPFGGPFLPPEQIQEIADWINAGAPDDDPQGRPGGDGMGEGDR